MFPFTSTLSTWPNNRSVPFIWSLHHFSFNAHLLQKCIVSTTSIDGKHNQWNRINLRWNKQNSHKTHGPWKLESRTATSVALRPDYTINRHYSVLRRITVSHRSLLLMFRIALLLQPQCNDKTEFTLCDERNVALRCIVANELDVTSRCVWRNTYLPITLHLHFVK